MNGYLNKRGDRIGKIDLISNPLNTKLIIIKKAQVDITGSDVSVEDVNEHKELETVKPCFMLASSSNGVNSMMGSRVDKNRRRGKGSSKHITKASNGCCNFLEGRHPSRSMNTLRSRGRSGGLTCALAGGHRGSQSILTCMQIESVWSMLRSTRDHRDLISFYFWT
jgi:hypothetical protein